MSELKMPSMQNSYETLPDLLSDLERILSMLYEEDNKRWFANIDCGGDFHNFTFSSTWCSSMDSNLYNEESGKTYDNLDSLVAEYQHVVEFLENNIPYNTNIDSFLIVANGGNPFIRIKCSGNNYDPEECEDESSLRTELKYYGFRFLDTLISSSAVMFSSIVPAYIIYRLCERDL